MNIIERRRLARHANSQRARFNYLVSHAEARRIIWSRMFRDTAENAAIRRFFGLVEM
jgi:hypothetical protein